MVPGGATVILKGQPMFSKRVVLSFVLSLAATAAAGQGQPADPDPNRFTREIQAFQEWDSKNAVPAGPVLFVGSSSIRLWRTRESFPGLPVVNRGFGGSHISDVIHFAGRVVLPYQPKVIVFYAGDNDIAAGKPAQRVLDDYRRLVQAVHAKLPVTRIIFITIKPSESRWSLCPEMSKANGLVRALCEKDTRLFFADLATPLLGPDGRPRAELFLKDQLHLNAAGYKVWTDSLRPILEKVLTSRPAGAAVR
jgi:lysophospholipase L1-like esterase